jgi:transposase
MKLYYINLTKAEREELVRFTTTGRHAARKAMHARILLKADEGLKDELIAEHLNVSVCTVERVRKRCAHEGLSAALNPKASPQRKPKLDGEGEARLVQIACSAPSDGRQQWTLHLLADKLVELEVVDSISHETVRQLKGKTVVEATEHRAKVDFAQFVRDLGDGPYREAEKARIKLRRLYPALVRER